MCCGLIVFYFETNLYLRKHVMENHQFLDPKALGKLIFEMKQAYARGDNAMAEARKILGDSQNNLVATLVAYDLQAGSYTELVKNNPESKKKYCKELTNYLNPLVNKLANFTLLEVGCGEATTLCELIKQLSNLPTRTIGFDLSWSRVAYGLKYMRDQNLSARLFVGDLFNIPLQDNSIDIVYTSHSLEPNGGKEELAIKELLRVARCAVVLFEPLYELASKQAQERMRHHGYVSGLKETAVRLGATIGDYGLLENSSNSLNPTGVLVLYKNPILNSVSPEHTVQWCCPLTYTDLEDIGDCFLSRQTGLVYPILRGIPMLRPQHAIVASAIS